MAIFDEQVLEPFVAKGIGNSGVASRQIQATNLPDLSAAVRQSQMTQQNLSDQQSATMRALAIKNYKAPSIRGASGGGGDGGGFGTKPFVLGHVPGSTGARGVVTIAVPDGKGSFMLKSVDPSNKEYLREFGLDNWSANDVLQLGLAPMSGKFTAGELAQSLLTYTKESPNLSKIISQLGSYGFSGTSGGGGGGSKMPFAIGPNISDQKWEAEQQKKKKAQAEVDATLAANRLKSRTLNISSMGGPSMLGKL